MGKFSVPKRMVQLMFQSADWHFVSDIDQRQLFTSCGKVAFKVESDSISTKLTREIPAKDICRKCLGGIIAYD